MAEQEKTIPKKRGRPATGTNQTVNVRIPPDMLDSLDAARTVAEGQPGRPEMIRRIVADWLKRHGFLKEASPRRKSQRKAEMP